MGMLYINEMCQPGSVRQFKSWKTLDRTLPKHPSTLCFSHFLYRDVSNFRERSLFYLQQERNVSAVLSFHPLSLLAPFRQFPKRHPTILLLIRFVILKSFLSMNLHLFRGTPRPRATSRAAATWVCAASPCGTARRSRARGIATSRTRASATRARKRRAASSTLRCAAAPGK